MFIHSSIEQLWRQFFLPLGTLLTAQHVQVGGSAHRCSSVQAQRNVCPGLLIALVLLGGSSIATCYASSVERGEEGGLGPCGSLRPLGVMASPT